MICLCCTRPSSTVFVMLASIARLQQRQLDNYLNEMSFSKSGISFGFEVLTRDVTTFVTSETEIHLGRAILNEVTNFLATCGE